MASTLGDKASELGHSVANGVERAAELFRDKTGIGPEAEDLGVGAIADGMDVIASCGKKVGVVDRVESGAIKLTKNDSPDSQHHYLPIDWVERVDSHVHLTKDSRDTEANWKCDASSCTCD